MDLATTPRGSRRLWAAVMSFSTMTRSSIEELPISLKTTGLKVKRTGVQAPWQNGTAERWVGSCRSELLDHLIALNEAHLRRLIRDYVTYHQEDRIHDALGKDTPNRRSIEPRPSAAHEVVSMPRLGGLHHRYAWRKAA